MLWLQLLAAYAEAAFPPGGSECARASREALTDLASRSREADGHVDIGAGQRPMLKAAVKWYFARTPPQDTHDRDLLLTSLERH